MLISYIIYTYKTIKKLAAKLRVTVTKSPTENRGEQGLL